MKVTAYFYNQTYVTIDTEPGVEAELRDHFSFRAVGVDFSPAVQLGNWDGYIRLYNPEFKLFYYGLLHELAQFCQERDYEFELDGDFDLQYDFSRKEALEFIDGLHLSASGTEIAVREHQLKPFVDIIRNRKRLLVSPTASGKSLILYLATRQLVECQNRRVLIIVPTSGLVKQLYGDFEDYSSTEDKSFCEKVHYVHAGRVKTTNLPVTITTWQSIVGLRSNFFESFDAVFVDEAHLAKAKSIKSIMEKMVNAEYRVGMTGTLDGSLTNKMVLTGLFGPVKQYVTTSELIEQKTLSAFEIKCIVLKHAEEDCIAMKTKTYQQELDFITKSSSRNKFIAKLAVSLEDNTLVLFQFVEKHGKELYEVMKKLEPNRKIYFVHGKIELEVREKVRAILESENNCIIIASYSIFSTGVNIRNLYNIVFASPSKSRVRVLQSIGRVLRTTENKNKAVLYDIVDNFRHGRTVNFTLTHFLERIKIYDSEKFEYLMYNINLKKD